MARTRKSAPATQPTQPTQFVVHRLNWLSNVYS